MFAQVSRFDRVYVVEQALARRRAEVFHFVDRLRDLCLECLDDPRSLASPDYQGYRPAWANPYAEPEELGVNDDPTPFNPADVDSGPNPLDPDAF